MECELPVKVMYSITFSLQLTDFFFYVRVTVHRNKFLYNKTN